MAAQTAIPPISDVASPLRETVISKPGAALVVKVIEIPRLIQQAITHSLEHGTKAASCSPPSPKTSPPSS